MAENEAKKVRVRILCGDVGDDFDWDDFRSLYKEWKAAVKGGETLEEMERQIKGGLKLAVVAAYGIDKPAGFSIADLKAGAIGWMYVAPKFRGVEVYAVAPIGDSNLILGEKPGLKLWQVLNKKAWTMVKMNGAVEVSSIIHKEAGGEIAAWRREHENEWLVPKQTLENLLFRLNSYQKISEKALRKITESPETPKKPQKSRVS